MNERILPDADLSQIKGGIKHGPFSDPYMSILLKHFGKEVFGRSSACMEFIDFLYKITGSVHEEMVCLEIGTFHGVTAALLSRFFKRVVCVSIDDAKSRSKLLKHEVVKVLGIKNITFHDVDTNEQKAEIINGFDFDFCYQDGDHTNDTESDFALVRRCGRVLFHEYWPLQPAVYNLVNSLPPEEVRFAQVDSFAYWERERG